MRFVRGLAIIGVAMLAALAAAPQLASAHARYKSSTPAAGAVVDTAPPEVVITFTEDIQKVSGTYNITVTDANGAQANSAPAVIDEQDRSKMSVQVPSNLPPGRYVVHWNNVSDADGDPFAGAFSFYVGMQPTSADAADDATMAAAQAPEATGTAAPAPATTKGPSTGPASPAASATPASSGGGSNTGLFIGVGVVVAAVLVAAGGFVVYRGRRG